MNYATQTDRGFKTARFVLTCLLGAGLWLGGPFPLQAGSPPSISVQPQSQEVMVGSNVTFSATASGTSPLSYQWCEDDSVILGATNSAFSIQGLALTDAGDYTLVVTN